MRTLLMVVVLAAGVYIHAQDAVNPARIGSAAPAETNALPPTGTVTGHVYCGDTRRPARLARVTLRAVPDANRSRGRNSDVIIGGSSSSTTDMDGGFRIAHVRPGRYYVDAFLPGYVSPMSAVDRRDLSNPSDAAQERVRSEVQIVEVTENDSASAEIILERGAAISGVVRFEDGSPASNVLMSVVPVPDGKNTSHSSTQNDLTAESNFYQSSRTDDRGRFRLTGLLPNTYLLAANVSLPSSAYVAPMKMSNGREYYLTRSISTRIYAPSSFHKKDAMKFSVVSGEERNDAEMTLPLSGLHMISGHFAGTLAPDSHGRRSVALKDNDDPSFTRTAYVEDDGTFKIEEVPDGNYTITAGNSGASVGVTVHGGDLMSVQLAPPEQKQ